MSVDVTINSLFFSLSIKRDLVGAPLPPVYLKVDLDTCFTNSTAALQFKETTGDDYIRSRYPPYPMLQSSSLRTEAKDSLDVMWDVDAFAFQTFSNAKALSNKDGITYNGQFTRFNRKDPQHKYLSLIKGHLNAGREKDAWEMIQPVIVGQPYCDELIDSVIWEIFTGKIAVPH